MGSDLGCVVTFVMECVEFFAGCGGAALGLQRAGLPHRLLVEADPFCALSLMANFPGVPVCTKNLFLHRVEEILKEQGIGRDFRGLIWLSPPCQGVSSGGLKLGEADIRNFLLFTAAAAAEYAPNAWIVVENVTGLQKGNAKPIFDELIRRLSAARDVATWELRAVNWGWAQDRNRLFIVAAPVGKKVPPEPRPPAGTVERFVKDEFAGFVDHDPDFFPLADSELPIYEEIGDGENWEASELGRKYYALLRFRGNKATFLRRTGSEKHYPCQQA